MSGSDRRATPLPRPRTEFSSDWKCQLAGILGGSLLRVWGKTWRVESEHHPQVQSWIDAGTPFIHSFWHAQLLSCAYLHRDIGAVVLISRSRDGEYISQVIHRLGYGTVRGSTSKGSLRALIEMGKAGKSGRSLGITPDGPRGPRHQAQSGALLIAARSGLPVVPLAVGIRSRKTLGSWDRLELPFPFTRMKLFTGEPLRIPSGENASALADVYGPRYQAGMDEVEARAEAWRRQDKADPDDRLLSEEGRRDDG